MKMDFENMSTSEIKIQQKKMSDEYEVIKKKIGELLNKLDSLDKEYISAQKEIDKRKKN